MIHARYVRGSSPKTGAAELRYGIASRFRAGGRHHRSPRGPQGGLPRELEAAWRACNGMVAVHVHASPGPVVFVERRPARHQHGSCGGDDDFRLCFAAWLLLPTQALVLVSGLWSMAITRAFHNAGWVLAKLALGVVMFTGVPLSVQGPVQTEAALSARALGGVLDPAVLGTVMHNEWAAVWVVLPIATGNVVLGVWRPKVSRRRKTPAKPQTAPASVRVPPAATPDPSCDRKTPPPDASHRLSVLGGGGAIPPGRSDRATAARRSSTELSGGTSPISCGHPALGAPQHRRGGHIPEKAATWCRRIPRGTSPSAASQTTRTERVARRAGWGPGVLSYDWGCDQPGTE